MPAVVPQLKSITIGGAVAGIGIESSSFRYGLVHETVEELDVLVGDGRVVTATPDNDHRDLFFGFPNSYGTLGYALRVKARALPAKPFVRLEHVHHRDARRFFDHVGAVCGADADFVDGAVFGPHDLVVTTGRFVDAAPYTSDYSFERIYWCSMRERDEDFLSTRTICGDGTPTGSGARKPARPEPAGAAAARPQASQLGLLSKVMRWNSRLGSRARAIACSACTRSR